MRRRDALAGAAGLLFGILPILQLGSACGSLLVLPGVAGARGDATVHRDSPPELLCEESLSSTDSSVTLVPPSQMNCVPEALRTKLTECGCLVPQVYAGNRLNVVTGHFEREQQLDWAVLCSRNGSSRIYVFWGGNPKRLSKLPARRDQPTPDEQGRFCYPRGIRPGSAERVKINYAPRAHGFPDPTHDVLIDDVRGDETETVYYRYRGQWVRLVPDW